MTRVTGRARTLLDRMEAGRIYTAADLLAFHPDLNVDALREVMRELWIAYHVERAGTGAWRRVSSAGTAPTPAPESLRVGVKPEELFDHDSFGELFK